MTWLHRLIQRCASSPPGAWLFARVLHHLDRPVLRLTQNRSSLTGALAGLPVVTLTTTGAKSGQPRSVPLVAVQDGDRLVLFASNFGQKHYPAWYYNLRAHPQATVTWRGQTRAYQAREAEGKEREDYWKRAVKLYAGYAAYEKRVGQRHIPIMVLSPVDG